MKRHKDFWQITEDSLDKSMKVFNIETSMKNELLDLYKVLSCYPEVKDTLNKLNEKNYKVSILCYESHHTMADHLFVYTYRKKLF